MHLTHGGGLFAERFTQMLTEDGVNLHCVPSRSEIRCCCTLINRQHRTVTEIVEEAPPVSPETDGLMRRRFESLLEQSDIITISGTTAEGYQDDIVPWMVKTASDAGRQVVLDVKGKDLLESAVHRPYIIKPNFKEFCETLFPQELVREHGTREDMLDAVCEKMRALHRDFGITAVLTRGADSVLYFDNGTVREEPIHPVEPVNTIGSGDAFTAGIAFGMSRQLSLKECIRLAVSCGGKNAGTLKPGSILQHAGRNGQSMP